MYMHLITLLATICINNKVPPDYCTERLPREYFQKISGSTISRDKAIIETVSEFYEKYVSPYNEPPFTALTAISDRREIRRLIRKDFFGKAFVDEDVNENHHDELVELYRKTVCEMLL